MDPPEGPTLANLTDKHVPAREKKTSEGAASAICSREELRKTEIAY